MLRQRTKPPASPSATGLKRRIGSKSKPSKSPAWLTLTPAKALILLLAARLASAVYNIISDCDEVYNYWEPLHYIMYGYGMQTWEYSAEYALRAWIYVLLHYVIGAPAAEFLGPQRGKITVFYLIRGAMACVSALTEYKLYKAVRDRYNSTISNIFLAFLVTSSGMFAASAAFLPSSFTMYAMTAAAAGVISNKPGLVIFSAVVGVIWGWCVAGLAFAPYALWVLTSAPLVKAFGTLFLALIVTLVPLVLADKHYYGTYKASLWNFLVYNVAGGGKSFLYGVEGPLYYLHNGFNQLQFVLPLGLVLPAAASFSGSSNDDASSGSEEPLGTDGRLLTAISPLLVWLAGITMLPHKEERFLYVVYPLACLAAAATLDIIGKTAASTLGGRKGASLGKIVVKLAVLGTVLLSLSRTTALVHNYSAPISVWDSLPVSGPTRTVNVCVGAEWYRFPSSFFLPGEAYKLRFLKSGFNGLLPRPFDPEIGGTKGAPKQLNSDNRQEPENYWTSADECDFAVTMETSDKKWLDEELLGSRDNWDVIEEYPFLNAAESPRLTRAFYIPGLSEKQNKWNTYLLLMRTASD